MTGTYQRWVEETRRRRGEQLPGEPFSPGLVDGAGLDPAAARRAIAALLVTLVGDRPAHVTFEAGTSFAGLEQGLVNVDGDFADPPGDAPPDVDEILVGVAAHEGGHLLLSKGAGRRASALRQWLYNLVEDERVEVEVARRWQPLSPALATARRALIRSERTPNGFLFALFYLVRAPDRMPTCLRYAYARPLRRAMRILTPFPATPEEVDTAIRRLARLVPHRERQAVPLFPSLALRAGRAGRPGRRSAAGRSAGPRADEWSEHTPAVVWTEPAAHAAGYAALRTAVQADAHALRAALLAPFRPRRHPAARRGVLDRRRLHVWPFDERLFRTARPAPRETTLALILDLSGSMRDVLPTVQHIAVAFSEAVLGLAHVRLYVYGHDADGGGPPSTQIMRFATPARGPVLSLGRLPGGANNRDGHPLDLLARDLVRLEPCRRRARVAIHVCDGDPCAAGYCGLPAREATRKGVAAFRNAFGPLVLLGVGPTCGLESLGPVLMWREGRAADLGRLLTAVLAACP